MTRSSRLIGLMGYAQAGKDTFGAALPSYERRAFADALKKLALACNPEIKWWVAERGWEWAKSSLPGCREFLQDLGVGAREILGSEVWVDAAFLGWSHETPTVFTDVRFQNEIDAIRDRGGLIIRITREGLEPPNNHISEQLVATAKVDYDIWAPDGGVEILQAEARRLDRIIEAHL